MKLDRLLALTRNPDLLGADESQDLETLVQEYPYFSAAQLLLTIKYKQQNTSRFNRQLQKSAAHLPDKNVLAAALHDDLARLQLLVSSEIDANETGETRLDVVAPIENVVAETSELGEERLPDAASEETVAKEVIEPVADAITEIDRVEEIEMAEVLVEEPEAGAIVEIEADHLEEAEVLLESPAPVSVEEAEAATEVQEVIEPISSPTAAPAEIETIPLTTALEQGEKMEGDEPVKEFLANAHDRLSWFRFFAGKPLREQPDDVLEELYLEHMSGDFLKADAATLPEIKSELKAVINHDPEVAQNKNLEEEIRRLAYESISDEELPASETLAAIYESQKDFKKALRIYQKLMLKFPDRMTYFAGLIASTKEKLNN